jgi:cell division protein FtsL
MLETINGFDLLLIITIIMLGIRAYKLNQECESYVQQILEVSWELQQEIQASKYAHNENKSYSLRINCDCESCIPF